MNTLIQDAPGVAQPATQSRSYRIAIIAFSIFIAIALGTTGAMLFIDMPKQVTGVLVIALSIVLLLMGIQVGVAMLGAALVGLWALSGGRVVESTLEALAFNSTASWSFSIIPMFILMGMLLWKSGLTASAFEAARRWLGFVPGGLAVSTNFAGAALSASSGTTIGITYALGRVSIPEMLKSGYHPQLAVGSVAAAGTLGQIIPPSLLLVVYAGAASVPVGAQLLAGIIPGVILALAYAALIIGWVLVKPSMAPRIDMSTISWSMRFQSLIDLIPITLVMLIVIGGMFVGIFTATEAGVAGMMAALGFGIFQKRRDGASWRDIWTMFYESLIGTLTGTASVFLLILGVVAITRCMALSQLPNTLAEYITEFNLGRIELLLILVVVYLILGTFMDSLAMMLLTIPVLLAPLSAVGVDPLWFGVFVVMMAEIGQLTPPLGILVYVVHRIASDPETNLGKPISMGTAFLGVTPFAIVATLVAMLMIFVPEVATWLPAASTTR